MLSDSVNKVLIITWVLLLVIPLVLFFLATLLRVPIFFHLNQMGWLLMIANEILATVGFGFSIYFAIKKQSFMNTFFISFGIASCPFLLSFYLRSVLH